MQKKCKKSLAFLIYICGCVGGTNAHHKAHGAGFFFPVYFQRKIGERMKLTEGGRERERNKEREREKRNIKKKIERVRVPSSAHRLN